MNTSSSTKKLYDEIEHEYSETFDYEPEFEFRLIYLRSEEDVYELRAYNAQVTEYNIDTL